MKFSCINYLNVEVPLRDGVKLNASVYLPAATGKFGCILSRSPYNFSGSRNGYAVNWCKKGFAFVDVDVRGRYGSEGVCDPGRTEFEDGYDTAEWICRQGWSDGRIVIFGGSYPGVTTISALASGHPAYVGASPSAITADWYETFYTNGVLELSFMMPWYLGMTTRGQEGKFSVNEAEWKKQLPVCDMDVLSGRTSPQWHAIVDHPDAGSAYWKKCSIREYAKNIKAPMYIRTSYFDLLGRYGYKLYTDLMASPETSDAFKKHSMLFIGPWGHGINTPEGTVDFGPEAMVGEEEELDFMQSCLEGKASASDRQPARVCYFTMVENKWHYADTFPVAGAADRSYFLFANGRLADVPGEGADHFTYDPADPVPTCGGRIVGAGGQRDQTEIEKRTDVLVYTAEPLTADQNVTGVVRAELYVSSSAPDTDFTVKLVDVAPDGTPLNVCDSIFRVRYSEGFDQERFLTRGEVRKLAFDVDFTSYIFRQGHRIRIEVSSSNFPHYERNLNMGTCNAKETAMQKAEQTIRYSEEYPSRIILPVL